MLFPVSYLLTSLSLDNKNLSASQTWSTWLNWRLRYNYFRFGKQTFVILEFYFRFRFRPYCRNPHNILHKVVKFDLYRTTESVIDFSRWSHKYNSTSGFLFVNATAFKRSKSISKSNFVDVSQFTAEITTPVLEKQTSAILEFYFWFRFRLYRRNLRVICIRLPKIIQVGLSIAEIWRHVYFKDGGRGRSILFSVLFLLMSLPSEGHNLSANQISSTYLNLWLSYNYFRFGKKTNVRHIACSFCTGPLNSIQIGPLTAEIWRHNRFLMMAAAAAQYYFRFRICWYHCFQKVQVYQQTKFRRHVSIYVVVVVIA